MPVRASPVPSVPSCCKFFYLDQRTTFATNTNKGDCAKDLWPSSTWSVEMQRVFVRAPLALLVPLLDRGPAGRAVPVEAVEDPERVVDRLLGHSRALSGDLGW